MIRLLANYSDNLTNKKSLGFKTQSNHLNAGQVGNSDLDFSGKDPVHSGLSIIWHVVK